MTVSLDVSNRGNLSVMGESCANRAFAGSRHVQASLPDVAVPDSAQPAPRKLMMALDQGQRRIDDPRQAFREAVADLDVRHPDMMRAA